jgi:hypothetical protein
MFKLQVILSGDIPDLLYWSADLARKLKRYIWILYRYRSSLCQNNS